MHEISTLISGLVVGESARWHEGRLWFSNWGAEEIVAVGLDSKSEVIGRGPRRAGFSIDWLPDGRLLVTGEDLLRQEPDGSFVTHADLRSVSSVGWNEIVVDGRGNIYTNSINFLWGDEEFKPGLIALVTPDGAVRKVAGDIAFPNGMVVTPDNRTLIVAESFTGNLIAFDIASDGALANRRIWAALGAPGRGDGICMDAEGAIWTSAAQGTEGDIECWRVREGGEIIERIELGKHGAYSCMLGGKDGRTLFMMVAEWWGPERMAELFKAHTGRVLMTRAPSPHAGWP